MTSARRTPMRRSTNQVTYPRKYVIEVLRTLSELVVSLDRLGSAEMPKREHDAALGDFLRRHDIFRKMARARRILSAPFATTPGAEGIDDLERKMQDVRYWKPGKRK